MIKWLYKLLRFRNDVNAIHKKKVIRRVAFRVWGKVSGKLFSKIFKG